MAQWARLRKTFGATIWALAWLVTAGLSWLVPPMQSPDEGSHMQRAYLISRGDLLLQPIPAMPLQMTEFRGNKELMAFIERARLHGGRAGGLIDEGLLKFCDLHMALAGNSDKRLSVAEKESLAQLRWTGVKRYYPLPGTGYYLPAIYVPQALGLAIGQLLDMSVQQSYRAARALSLLTCFAMLWFAFRLVPPNPLVLALLLLPMSMFQLLSPTIDGLTTSLSVLVVSLFLNASDTGRPDSPGLSWGLAISIFLLATSRNHLLPLLVLPFYLAWRRRSRRDFYLGCWIAAAAMAWTLFALHSTNDPRIARDHTTTQLLLHYAANPGAFLRVVFDSLADRDLFTFYQRSFIGILGWLDAPLPEYFYPTLWTGLALCCLASVSVFTLQVDWRARMLLLVVAMASIGLVFLALLVTWTPHPASVVRGVQGRYFLVPIILLGYVVSGVAPVRAALHGWFAGIVLTGFSLASLTALIMTLFSRYH